MTAEIAEGTSSNPKQRSVIQRTGSNTFVYWVGIFLSKMISLIMLPILTRYITKSDYGVLALIEMTLDIIGIMSGTSLAAGIYYLYHKFENEEERAKVLSTCFILIVITYTLAGVIVWVMSESIAELILGDLSYAPLFHIAAASLVLQGLQCIPIMEIQLLEKSLSFIVINIVKMVIQIILTIVLLVFFGMGTKGVLMATLLANIAISVPLSISFLTRFGLKFSWDAMQSILRLGLPFIGVQLAKFVMTYGDRYFLQKATDTAAVGLYALGYQFGFLMSSISWAPFITAWDPIRYEISKRPDRDLIFNRVFNLLNLVLISLAVGIVLFVNDFLHVVVTPTFYPAAQVVPIILVAYIAQSWTGFHNFGLFAAERTEIITISNWLGAIIAIIFYVLLIPKYHAMGAAWATLFSFVASEVLIYIAAQRVYRINYLWTQTIRLCLIAFVVCVFSLLLPEVSLIPSIGLHSVLFILYLVLVWNGGVLEDSDKAQLRQAVYNPRSLTGMMPWKV